MDELHLRLTSHPLSIAAARRAVAELDVLAPEERSDVALLVSELVTNSIRHACGDQDAIDVRGYASADVVHIEVTDHGPGFVAPERPTPRLEGEEPGGLGLVLVDRLADRWGVARDDGTSVWFEIKRVAA